MINITKSGCNDMLEDVFKIITYILVTHLLTVVVEDDKALIDDTVLKKLLYSSISMVVFHFVVKKLLINKKINKKVNKKINRKIK